MPDPREADIVISGLKLSEGQSLAIRVAVNNFLMELEDEKFRNGLGYELADAYKARLSEIIRLISLSAR